MPETIGPDLFFRNELHRSGEYVERHALKRFDALLADLHRSFQQHGLVDQTVRREARGDARPALDHQPGNAFGRERLEHRGEVEVAVLLRDAKHAHAFILQDLLGDWRRLRRAEHPCRAFAHGRDNTERERRREPRIEYHTDGRALLHPGQTGRELRVVGEHCADPDQDGVVLRAQLKYALTCALAGDRGGLASGKARFAVGRYGELEQHMRTRSRHARDVARMRAPRFVRTKSDVDLDALLAQPRMALARDLRVRVFQRGDNARNTGADDGVGARRRLAGVRAWLERGVHRRAPRILLGALAGFG